VQVVNEVSLMGSAKYLYQTPNALFAFVSIERDKLDIDAMVRAANICDAYDLNPSDPLLQQYRDMCRPADPAMRPRLPSVVDFFQVVSGCVSGNLCADFVRPSLESVGGGYYSKYGFDRTECPEGSYCPSPGVKVECPVGFVCDQPRLLSPTKCLNNDKGDSGCFQPGLQRPEPCPSGFFCFTTYLPPIPAPPGVKQGIHGRQGPRVPVACMPGEFCPLSRAVKEGKALLCPEGLFCNDTALLTPFYCPLPDKQCFQQQCPEQPEGCVEQCSGMSYCPNGTIEAVLCPVGSFCESPAAEALPCSDSSFCPAGTFLSTPCPAGFYCPDPTLKVVCPSGFYCPLGTHLPFKCGTLDLCPVGSDKKRGGVYGVCLSTACLLMSSFCFISWLGLLFCSCRVTVCLCVHRSLSCCCCP
jgi:hypothetical protein